MAKKNQTQFDKMTLTPIPKLLLTLSVPSIFSMLVTNLYNIVDTAFVGTLGTSASGAVGVVFGFMAILQAVSFMFGQGSGSILARKLGAQDPKAASAIASTGFFGVFAVGVLLSLGSFIFLDKIIILLGSTPTIAPYAKTYITYILATAPFLMCGFTMNNILRYEGMATRGMIGMMTGAVLNILGDYVFIFIFELGVHGAGLSTAISQFISFCVLLSPFVRGKTQSRINIKYISYHISDIFDIMSTGFPSLLRQALGSIATIVLNTLAGVYGDAAIAGMSIASRLVFFMVSISLGVGQGFQPISGFSYGAKQYARLKEAFLFTLKVATVIMVVLSIGLYIAAPYFVQLLRDDPAVIEVGVRAIRLQCLVSFTMSLGMLPEMLMQSTGRRLEATILSSLRNGIVFIPALIILAQFRGLYGIEEAQAVAFVLSAPPSVYLAYRFFKKLDDQTTL